VSLQPVDPHRAGDATTWPLVIEPRSATTLVLDPAADGDGRQQPTLELAASPLTKGGMPTSDLRPTHEAR
jgi:hypothetical protein